MLNAMPGIELAILPVAVPQVDDQAQWIQNLEPLGKCGASQLWLGPLRI